MFSLSSILALALCTQCPNGLCPVPDQSILVQQPNLALPRVTVDAYTELAATRQALAQARAQLDQVLQAWSESQATSSYPQQMYTSPYQQPMYTDPYYRSPYSMPYSPMYRRPLIGAFERLLFPGTAVPRPAQPKMR